MKQLITLGFALALTLAGLWGCQSSPGVDSSGQGAPSPSAAGGPADLRVGGAAGAGNYSSLPAVSAPPSDEPLAFVNNTPITWSDVDQLLLESSGGQVLADLVVQKQIAHMLAQRGQQIGPAQIEAERKLLMQTLNPDPDQAQRLLDELRDRRGFGPKRFALLLARNAALRLLVQPDVKVTDAAVQQAYDLLYGPRYQARIITTDTLAAADDVVHRAHAGGSFSDLAVQCSTDPSRAQGGLLSPISPADSTYPDTIREMLIKMSVGAVSNPLALERGYAILKLERIVPGQKVKLSDVKADLQMGVRRDVERMLMDRLVRTLVEQADVVVMAPALQPGWQREKQKILGK